jgi:hypothetical protein
MPFENFYEESDKARRRWWKCVGLAFLLFTGYWAFAFSTMPDFEGDRRTAENLDHAERQWRINERVRQVENLCRYLPTPEKFFLVRQEVPKNFADSTSIVYRYNSNRAPAEIMPSFLLWFNANGWRSISADGLMFKKENQTVSIRVLKPYDFVSGYEIQCLESDY